MNNTTTIPPNGTSAKNEELQADINAAIIWTARLVDGSLQYLPQSMLVFTGFKQCPGRSYTKAEFIALDHRLPDVYTSLASGNDHVSGKLLQASYNLLRGAIATLPEGMFLDAYRTRPIRHAVISTFTMANSPTGDGVNRLHVRFDGFEVSVSGQGNPYVTGGDSYLFELNPAWLDQHRPGWRNTVLLAETLGLGDADYAQLLLFDADRQTPANVPGNLAPGAT